MSENFTYIPSEDSDYLMHYAKGEGKKNALYTARKWVNGKWQYVYNNVNNALGADERANRDSARRTETEKLQNYSATTLGAANAKNKAYANRARGQAAESYSRAKSNREAAEKAYDRTVYGQADKAKAALGRVKEKLSNAIGINQLRDRNAANDAYDSASSKYHATLKGQSGAQNKAYAKAQLNKAGESLRGAQLKKTGAQRAYDKTLLGKMEKGKNAIAKALSKVKSRAKNKAAEAKEAYKKSKYNRDLKKNTRKTGGFRSDREFREFAARHK
jgi:lambda repressor-like predicted transcriptional regulator